MAMQIEYKNTGSLLKPVRVAKKKKLNPASQHRGMWSRFRKQFLKKHELWGGWYACSWCNIQCKQSDIDLDHIHTRGSRPDLVYEPTNLRLLCRPCHVKRHQ